MTKTCTQAKSRFVLRIAAAAFLTIGVAFSAGTAQAAPSDGNWALFDHPDGNLNTDYGLRLDNYCNVFTCSGTPTADERTFSVEAITDDISSVTLNWAAVNGSTANISGHVKRNSDDSIWSVDFDIEGIVLDAQGFVATHSMTNPITGSLTGTNMGSVDRTGDMLSLTGKGTPGFIFHDDGHRCQPGGADYGTPCDLLSDNEVVPRGWVMVNDISPTKTNDWLTVAKKLPDVVSEPGTLAVLGFGLIGLGYARRRRLI